VKGGSRRSVLWVRFNIVADLKVALPPRFSGFVSTRTIVGDSTVSAGARRKVRGAGMGGREGPCEVGGI